MGGGGTLQFDIMALRCALIYIFFGGWGVGG